MGQKVNATIFRTGIKNNEWKSKYFEKNTEEYSFYNFQNLEIKKYLEQFLKRNGLVFHDYKLHYTTNTLYLFISFYQGVKSVSFINKINASQKIKLKKKKKFKKQKKKNKNLNELKVRTTIIRKYKNLTLANSFHTKKILKKNSFLEQLLESLSVFSNQKPNLFIVFQQFNKDLSLNLDKVEKKDLKKKLFLLRKYLKNNFFKEIMNILLLSVRLKNSAQLLADSVAEQISVMKKHNYFLIFLKRALILFLWSKFSRVNGIKISLKGRFNGVLRARKRTIEIGNIPAQELNSNITYHQATSFTSNGTFGVKVWINEKKKKMLLQPKKFKHKKIKKGKLLKFKFKSNSLKFGTIGLKASESGYITARQIESARQAITRKIKRKGKLWIKIFPNLPITSKPTEVRMGKGTGKISHWVARVKGGTIIFEISGVNLNIVVPALKTGSAKLPIKTIIFK